MQNRRPHEKERNGRDREDHHTDPGIQIHHPNPAARAIDPFGAVIHSSHIACVSFFEAPVGVDHQFARPHAESPGHFIPRNWKIRRRQSESCRHGDQGQANNENRRDGFNSSVAATPQKQDCCQASQHRPGIIGSFL